MKVVPWSVWRTGYVSVVSVLSVVQGFDFRLGLSLKPRKKRTPHFSYHSGSPGAKSAMSISRLWIPIAFMMALSASAFAKEELPPIKVHHEAGVDYVYGGMDPLEHKALAKIAERYQVQLAFSQEGTNEKLTGGKVTMIDEKGD